MTPALALTVTVILNVTRSSADVSARPMRELLDSRPLALDLALMHAMMSAVARSSELTQVTNPQIVDDCHPARRTGHVSSLCWRVVIVEVATKRQSACAAMFCAALVIRSC